MNATCGQQSRGGLLGGQHRGADSGHSEHEQLDEQCHVVHGETAPYRRISWYTATGSNTPSIAPRMT